MRDTITFFLLLFLIPINISAQTPQVGLITFANLNIEESSKRSLEHYKIPFELEGGLIFVRAELNGKNDKYILDTGAPTLIINAEEEEMNAFASEVQGQGVSGDISMQTKEVKNFVLGTIKRNFFTALVTDFSHIEVIKARAIKGLIGLDVFRNQELLFDYEAKEIAILSSKKKHFEDKIRVKKVSFRMQEHIPVIKIKIGKKTYHFGIDSGAEVNLLNQRFLEKIKSEYISDRSTIKLCGIGKEHVRVETAIIKEIGLKGRQFHNMEFVFTDMSAINNNAGVELDGVLGFPFLSAALMSIDFKKKNLYLWERLDP